MSTAAIAAVAAQRRKIIRRFTELGATVPQRAIEPAAHGISEGLIFQKLVRERILVQAGRQQYYLDEAEAAAIDRVRKKVVTLVLILLAVLFAIGALLGYAKG